jgi:tight adherence protein B
MNAVVVASTGGSWMLLAGAAALFLAMFVAVAAVTLPGVRRRRLAKELAAATEPESSRSQMSSLGMKAAEFAERGLARHDRDAALANALERAGIDMRAPEFVVLAAVTSVGAALVGALLGGLLLAVVGIGISVGAFCLTVSTKATNRSKKFDEQLPDTLTFLAGSLRAGHSLPQSIDSLVQEAQSPTKEEFQRALFETQLGHTLPDALAMLAERVRSEDFDWVVQAIGIQRDVGGDLAAVLDNVTRTIRDRTRVRRQIDTLTAEGRFSAIILLALPIVMFLFLAVVNPSYVGELTTTLAGTVMLAIGGGLMVVGAIWLKRITRLVF